MSISHEARLRRSQVVTQVPWLIGPCWATSPPVLSPGSLPWPMREFTPHGDSPNIHAREAEAESLWARFEGSPAEKKIELLFPVFSVRKVQIKKRIFFML